ncbi:MAG: hypothetical protein HC844_06960 [Tabrizicola sp.]|nr:hypothetical protein [Tabrizicola sp.]
MKNTFNTLRGTAFGVVSALAFAMPVLAGETRIVEGGDGVVFVNLLRPNDGVSIDQLATQLTTAMENDASKMPGFRTASVHVSRDNSYVLNYAQWDNTESVDAVVAALGEGKLPDLAKAFSMATPEFHPYDVYSITLAGE